jgi:phage shock protein A
MSNKENEWVNASMGKEEPQQEQVLNPNDFVDVDDLVFDIGAKQTSLLGYKNLVKRLLENMKKLQKSLETVKQEKDVDKDTYARMEQKINNLTTQNKEYRDKLKFYIDNSKEQAKEKEKEKQSRSTQQSTSSSKTKKNTKNS